MLNLVNLNQRKKYRMSLIPFKCKECRDSGKYKVYNAYDPDYEEEVACEYCNTVPKLESNSPLLN